MTIFNCKRCNYTTDLKSNFTRHLRSLNHIKKHTAQNQQNTAFYTAQNQHFSEYFCKYCNKRFSHSQSMYRHIKYSCHKNNDEDLKELVRLMNLQMQQKDKELEFHKNQNEKQQKQIDKLMDKLKVNHITHHTTHIQNNIQLLSYKDTDVSHLTNKDFEQSIKKVNSCVKDMIEKIHFNPSKPENMNIYISNMKDKYIMVYEDGTWNIKHRNNELDTLYDMKEMLLEDWLDKYGNEELKQKFNKYLMNKTHEETLSMIKDDIKLMMYNKKKCLE